MFLASTDLDLLLLLLIFSLDRDLRLDLDLPLDLLLGDLDLLLGDLDLFLGDLGLFLGDLDLLLSDLVIPPFSGSFGPTIVLLVSSCRGRQSPCNGFLFSSSEEWLPTFPPKHVMNSMTPVPGGDLDLDLDEEDPLNFARFELLGLLGLAA